jgi:hypothetical protein
MAETNISVDTVTDIAFPPAGWAGLWLLPPGSDQRIRAAVAQAGVRFDRARGFRPVILSRYFDVTPEKREGTFEFSQDDWCVLVNSYATTSFTSFSAPDEPGPADFPPPLGMWGGSGQNPLDYIMVRAQLSSTQSLQDFEFPLSWLAGTGGEVHRFMLLPYILPQKSNFAWSWRVLEGAPIFGALTPRELVTMRVYLGFEGRNFGVTTR